MQVYLKQNSLISRNYVNLQIGSKVSSDLSITLVVIFHDTRRIAFLSEALNSVRSQIIPFTEVILVDSSQGGVKLMQMVSTYSDLNLKHVQTDLVHPSAKRNLGVEVSNDDIVCFLDDDNILLADYSTHVLRQFLFHPSCELTFSAKINFEGARLVSAPRMKNCSYKNLLRGNLADSSTIAIRRSSQNLPRWDVSLFHEDWAFLIDAFDNGVRIYPIFHRTVLYRIHGGARRNRDFKRITSKEWLAKFRPSFLDPRAC